VTALAHGLAHESFAGNRSKESEFPIWLHNRKRPAAEVGRFWGYYREERAAKSQA
jgi:hypothetical protein